MTAGAIAAGIFGATLVSTAAETIPALTEPLTVLLQRGAAAFAAGDFNTAATAFAEVERAYGSEPEWTDGPLPKRLLPLRGFAELRAGRPEDAADSLLAFIERFPDETSARNLALYSLALALRETGRTGEALTRFSQFEQENPGTAQAALAVFQRAEIHHQQGQIHEALQLLRDLASQAPTESLRVQARLRALQFASESRDDNATRDLLLGEPWTVSTMPEIGVLAFAAMRAGDQFLAAGNGAEAIRAYRLVLPKERLLKAQWENLARLERRFDERIGSIDTAAGSFWVDFYRARLARIRKQLEALEAAEDYTASLQLRLGQAFLLAERPREAWLVFERLCFDTACPPEIRGEAQYRWILAAADLHAWEEALAIARDFVQNHPAHPQAVEALQLIARAHLERHRMPEAETVLSEVINRFPEHPSQPRARFTRGWVRVMQEAFEPARSDFDLYLAEHPHGPLAVNAALWRALSFFFERNYDQALASLEQLASAHRDHPLYPEIIYRQGTTLYAMRRFDDALAVMEDFEKNWPHHVRYPEALVLIGDILMGAGRLEEAMARFAQVPPEAGSPYVYAVFQTGKILRALEDYPGMIAHFLRYAQQPGAQSMPRVSEALYWVAWAHEQQGDPAAALPHFLAVLERFGNDPTAGEVSSSIDGLERLVRRLRKTGTTPAALPAPAADLLEKDFDTWLETSLESAREAKRFTWFARLSIALADRHARRHEPFQAEARLLDVAATAPIEQLDATALARVGLKLQEIGSPRGVDYFRRLLETNPQSFERGAAYYGLAEAALSERRFLDARRWLAKFDTETPTHPLAPAAALLGARTLEEQGRHDEAFTAFEAVLRLKSARGRPHAEALAGMSRCAIAMGDPRKAIACCQRIYTMYRAFGDLVAQAYLDSGALFEQIGNDAAAAATYREMLALPSVGDAARREKARRMLDAVSARMPEPATQAEAPAKTRETT